ncbi:hypothetical protein KVR01_002373 [Diaporthe batatas]|uniref:uncharacterized protein n=1 Tax=Diaporthe batatas TaxID=748121 RepID=UPI001D044D68|nr:uncharacterized protein KVR01_002373 [Diaporthe batatas]KAG8166684.1 hypothetical protein KVR01_002373 [Diaporthe batatas]
MTGPEVIAAANGVAGLFNTLLAWFEYVYIAKEAHSRLQSIILQLDGAQLRLSRWGEAAGLDDISIEDESFKLDSLVLDEHQQSIAIETFKFICARFEECQKICLDARGDKTEDDPEVEKREKSLSGIHWTPKNKYLHDTMRKIVSKRKNKIGVVPRIKFAIYDEKHLQDLINHINDHIDSLYKIFPLPDDTAALDRQSKLTKHEITELLSVMETLGAAIRGRDELLGSAIGVILDQKNEMRMEYHSKNVNNVVQGQMTGGQASQHNTRNSGGGGEGRQIRE